MRSATERLQKSCARALVLPLRMYVLRYEFHPFHSRLADDKLNMFIYGRDEWF